MATAVRVN